MMYPDGTSQRDKDRRTFLYSEDHRLLRSLMTASTSNIKPFHMSDNTADSSNIRLPLLSKSEDKDLDDLERHADTDAPKEITDESSWQIGLQVFFPFLVGGFGMVAAGMLLDIVQHWDAFVHVTEIFILVPALLDLKGNLEMTLAARLSTQANLGNMDSGREQWLLVAGNLALTQVQACVVGFLAAVAAILFGLLADGDFNIHQGFLLCAGSVITASLASLLLGVIMAAVVMLSRRCHVNPDNVATPIASSLGDIITLALLSGSTRLLWNALNSGIVWLSPLLLFIFLVLTPLWTVISYRNKYTYEVLCTGWVPVIGAVIISSTGGMILRNTIGEFQGIAAFQPVVSGVGGILVAVQASRLSTALHQQSIPGKMPKDTPAGCINPCRVFFGQGLETRTARVLMMLVVPGHLIFIATIFGIKPGHTVITVGFTLSYLAAAIIQVGLLLFIANWMVRFLWKTAHDPDTFSIPFLESMGDLLGAGLLSAVFHFLFYIGDPSLDLEGGLNTTTSVNETIFAAMNQR